MHGKHRESGQDIVEFALIAPLLFLLVFGVIEIGTIIYGYNTISNAAREAARFGVVQPNFVTGSPEASDILATEKVAYEYVRNVANLGIDDPETDTEPKDIQASYSLADRTIEVTVTYEHTLFGGVLPDMTLRAQSKMRVE